MRGPRTSCATSRPVWWLDLLFPPTHPPTSLHVQVHYRVLSSAVLLRHHVQLHQPNVCTGWHARQPPCCQSLPSASSPIHARPPFSGARPRSVHLMREHTLARAAHPRACTPLTVNTQWRSHGLCEALGMSMGHHARVPCAEHVPVHCPHCDPALLVFARQIFGRELWEAAGAGVGHCRRGVFATGKCTCKGSNTTRNPEGIQSHNNRRRGCRGCKDAPTPMARSWPAHAVNIVNT